MTKISLWNENLKSEYAHAVENGCVNFQRSTVYCITGTNSMSNKKISVKNFCFLKDASHIFQRYVFIKKQAGEKTLVTNSYESKSFCIFATVIIEKPA